MKIDQFTPENPALCEVAVGPGTVIINYRSTVPTGQWGHLSFTPAEADILISTLQEARKQAVKGRN